MDLLHPLPFVEFIELIRTNNNNNINFNMIKDELNKKDEHGNLEYRLKLKENDDLFIVYNDFQQKNNNSASEFKNTLELGTRSCIFEKDTLNLVTNQYNKIIYNDEAIDLLKQSDWDNVVVEKCYEGTLLTVYNHNNKSQ